MVVAVAETKCGMSNFCARGYSRGRRNYPNFSKHVASNFKTFVSATTYCFVIRSGGMLTKETDHETCTYLHLTNIIRKGKI